MPMPMNPEAFISANPGAELLGSLMKFEIVLKLLESQTSGSLLFLLETFGPHFITFFAFSGTTSSCILWI